MRTIFTAMFITVVLSLPINVYAGNGDVIVHVTEHGEKYHSAGCRYLKSDIEITLRQAVNKGYTRCSSCNPPKYEPDDVVSSSSGTPYSSVVAENKDLLSNVSEINGFDRNSKEIADYQDSKKAVTNAKEDSEKDVYTPREYLDIGFWYEDEFDFLLIIIGLLCIIIFQNFYYHRK